VNLTLEGLIAQCKVGTTVIDLCKFGTTVMETAAMKLYTKKNKGQDVQRGVAFPICISVNDVVCNHSPLASEEVVSCTHRFHHFFNSCWSQYQVIAECVYQSFLFHEKTRAHEERITDSLTTGRLELQFG
jgi:hypothetical protein